MKRSSWSSVLGAADVAYTWGSWLVTPSEERFFRNGYGDIEGARKLRADFLDAWARDGLQAWWDKWGPLEMDWSAESGSPESIEHSPRADLSYEGVPQHAQVFNATFMSPVADHLPTECALVHVRFVLPCGPVRGIVVHTAATNDEDYATRQAKLAEPLLAHGIGSVMVLVPFYGVRRAAGQTKSMVLTVADYLLQNFGTILEGCALLRWLHENYPGVPLGVTGISWGGAMASVIAVVSRLPIACIPCVGSTSPGCMVNGIIRWQLDWDTLLAECRHTLPEARAQLEAEFRCVTLRSILERAPQPVATIGSMVAVSACSDYFVPADEGQELYDVLSVASCRHQLRWIDGGHVAAFIRADTDFVQAIVAAFDIMAEESPSPAAPALFGKDSNVSWRTLDEFLN